MDEKKITEIVRQVVKEELGLASFSYGKITDNPKDGISIVNRRFLELHGLVSERPNSSVATIGQHYFATDTGIPMVYSAEGWRNGVGSIVAT